MFNRQSILVVEDNAIVALGLSGAIEEWDGSVIGPVGTVAEALDLLATHDIDGAVLDSQLIDHDVSPIALRLLQRCVPFVIHTGTGLPAPLAHLAARLTVLAKPLSPQTVITVLADTMKSAAAANNRP